CLPVVAKVGCGHTNLYNLEFNAATKKSLVYLPYRFFIEDKTLYVIENLSANKSIPLGARIESINDEPIQEIIDFILSCMPADGYNQSYRRRMASKGFTYYYHALYGINDQNKVSYTFENTEHELAFKCSELIPVENEVKEAVKPLDFQINEELNTGTLTVKTFAFYNNQSQFYNFIDSTFAIIESEELENLIIDLRGNQGGDPYCASYLLRSIANEPIQYYKDDTNYPELLVPQKSLGYELVNKPLVLIDGFGFSSTGHIAALIQEHNLGTFIGEELGSTYSCNGAQRNTTLEATGLFLQVGQKVVDVEVDPARYDKTKGIMPEIEVVSSVQSTLDNRDLVMERALDLIRVR
ncbi:MAG: S41 family peptidase, partial [Bacteroidota bacterium]